MKLIEKFIENKKKCRACGEEFSVEPLACPKCGAKVKTHKAEKWGAIIGAFAGVYATFWGWAEFEKLLFIQIAGNSDDQSILSALSRLCDGNPNGSILNFFKFHHSLFFCGAIAGCFVGFIIAFVIKKIVLAVRAKEAKSND